MTNSEDNFLKIIFSGTNINVKKSIVFGSDVKFYPLKAKLCHSSAQEVETMLNLFLRMDLVPKSKRDELYKQLVGPFRILEHFLYVVYQDREAAQPEVE